MFNKRQRRTQKDMAVLRDALYSSRREIRTGSIGTVCDDTEKESGVSSHGGDESGRVRRALENGNRVNLLVFRCLTSPRNSADYTDAFEGLCACCWLARRNLYVLPEEGEGGFADSTRAFIEKQLSRLLREYKRLGREEIDRRALAGDFRHTARVVRNRMRDHIRKTYRKLRAGRQPEPEPPSPEPSRQEMELAVAHLKRQWPRFAKAIGWRAYQTLRLALTVWPLGRTRRERRARIVAAIAARRKVSPQQARADRRALLSAVEDSNNADVIALRSAGWFRWVFGLASA